MTPVALTVAGSDPSGGAGIQADLKTFSALRVYGTSVLTGLTAQNTLGVQGAAAIDPGFVRAQLDSVLGDVPVSAIKTGMLPNAAVVVAVAEGLARHGAPRLVVDPVMVATSGDRLVTEDAVAAIRSRLLPLATVITPNLPEAATLLGAPVAGDEAAVLEQGRRLLDLGPPAVLMKGGHGSGPDSVDLLVRRGGVLRFATPRLRTRNTHGTGCTLSAAIAAFLARGLELADAVEQAKDYLTAALAAADTLSVGAGAGPVHHFHAWWGSGPDMP